MFGVKRKRPQLVSVIPILLLLLVLALFGASVGTVSHKSQGKELDILTQAVHRSITQCYALEGAYPKDLDYLVDHYGLLYNKEQYFIDYQFIGANLRPDITIIERD